MTRDVHPTRWPSREFAGGLPGRYTRYTPVVPASGPPPGAYGPPPVGSRFAATVRAPGLRVAQRAAARRVTAGPTQQITVHGTRQITVLGTRPTGRRDREGAV
ncbi:hypothetical protein [Streptomyces sp. NPDC002845]